MTNKKFGLGILVMALVFGMTVVGCGGGGSGSSSTSKTSIGNNDAGEYAGTLGQVRKMEQL
jgi:hypothetical protein